MKNKTQSVSVRFEIEYIKYLKTIARKLSAKQDKNISLSLLIREIIQKIYPME